MILVFPRVTSSWSRLQFVDAMHRNSCSPYSWWLLARSGVSISRFILRETKLWRAYLWNEKSSRASRLPPRRRHFSSDNNSMVLIAKAAALSRADALISRLERACSINSRYTPRPRWSKVKSGWLQGSRTRDFNAQAAKINILLSYWAWRRKTNSTINTKKSACC